MKKLLVFAVCGVRGLVLAVPGGMAAGKRGETKVVCIAGQPFQREYKERPKHCIFHHRHKPLAEAFFIETHRDHWRFWHHDKAKGHGRSSSGMGGGSTPVRIRLFDPVHRCGHRAFSKGHFVFPQLGNSTTIKLDTCA